MGGFFKGVKNVVRKTFKGETETEGHLRRLGEAKAQMTLAEQKRQFERFASKGPIMLREALLGSGLGTSSIAQTRQRELGEDIQGQRGLLGVSLEQLATQIRASKEARQMGVFGNILSAGLGLAFGLPALLGSQALMSQTTGGPLPGIGSLLGGNLNQSLGGSLGLSLGGNIGSQLGTLGIQSAAQLADPLARRGVQATFGGF